MINRRRRILRALASRRIHARQSGAGHGAAESVANDLAPAAIRRGGACLRNRAEWRRAIAASEVVEDRPDWWIGDQLVQGVANFGVVV